MKAIIKNTKNDQFTLQEVEEPKIVKGNEVKIKMLYSSICGTDVHIYKWDEWSQKEITLPHINGHEGVGQVVEIGSEVANVAIGDYVSYETHYYCGKCDPCSRGKEHVCKNMKILGVHIDGVWREKAVVPSELLFKIPQNVKVPVKYLGILEPFGNAHHTLSYTNLHDKNILIQGDGPIGIFATLIARQHGARRVILSGWGDTIRQKIAKDIGITFIDRSKLNESEYEAKVHELTNNEGIQFIGEFTGNPSALKEAISIIDPGGQISVLSIYPKGEFAVDINSLVLKNATMQFICGRKIFETWEKSFELINSGKINLKDIDKIITHEFSLEDFKKGFDEIMAGRAGKVLLKINPV